MIIWKQAFYEIKNCADGLGDIFSKYQDLETEVTPADTIDACNLISRMRGLIDACDPERCPNGHREEAGEGSGDSLQGSIHDVSSKLVR